MLKVEKSRNRKNYKECVKRYSDVSHRLANGPDIKSMYLGTYTSVVCVVHLVKVQVVHMDTRRL